MPDTALPMHGFTVPELARRWRVREDCVRRWIKKGELPAINTRGALGRPRFVVLPEALAAFERGRAVTPPPRPARRRKKTDAIDFFPD